MTTRLGVISDTHLTSASGLPQRIEDLFADVAQILHAGDVLAEPVLRALEEIAPVMAVSGNMDYPATKARLPEASIVKAEGVRIGLIHGHGVPGEVLDREDYTALHDYLRRQFDEPIDCIVYGHTHTAMNKKDDEVLFFNPGTATGRGAPPTVGILTVEDDQVTGEIVELS